MQGQIEQKLNNINTGNPIEGVKAFLRVRPVGLRQKGLALRDIEGFHFLMSKIPEKQYESVIRHLSEGECELLLDYLHRFMQHIGETEQNIMAGGLLKLYEKIVSIHGPTIILRAISREDTLVQRIQNF